MSDLRQDQRAATRARIVAAVSDLVAHDHPAVISVPAVADRAGVAVATVYRYFPNKEELLDAAAVAPTTSAANMPTTFEELGPALAGAWDELATQLPLVRGQFASPVGRDLHRRRWEAKYAAMSDGLRARGVDPDGPVGRRLLGTVDVLTSSTALLELHDKAGVPADQAAEWCTWAVAQLLRATIEEAT